MSTYINEKKIIYFYLKMEGNVTIYVHIWYLYKQMWISGHLSYTHSNKNPRATKWHYF